MPQKDGVQVPTEADICSGDRRSATAWPSPRGATARRPARSWRRSPQPAAHRIAPRAGRHRRHGREVRQRRRGVAEADRLQERPGAVHDVRAGRRVARVAATITCRRASPRSTSGCPASAGSRRSTSTRCWRASSRPRRRSSQRRHTASQGSAAPAELETALQLLYLDFTAPGDDPDAFALMQRQLDAAVANRGRSPGPGVRREDRGRSTPRTTTRRSRSPPSRSRRSTARRCSAFYKQRFSNAADFTFFMVGAFKVDTALPLLASTSAACRRAGPKTSTFKDIGVRFPDRDSEGRRRERARAARRRR